MHGCAALDRAAYCLFHRLWLSRYRFALGSAWVSAIRRLQSLAVESQQSILLQVMAPNVATILPRVSTSKRCSQVGHAGQIMRGDDHGAAARRNGAQGGIQHFAGILV
jgi:hypothetical protein